MILQLPLPYFFPGNHDTNLVHIYPYILAMKTATAEILSGWQPPVVLFTITKVADSPCSRKAGTLGLVVRTVFAATRETGG